MKILLLVFLSLATIQARAAETAYDMLLRLYTAADQVPVMQDLNGVNCVSADSQQPDALYSMFVYMNAPLVQVGHPARASDPQGPLFPSVITPAQPFVWGQGNLALLFMERPELDKDPRIDWSKVSARVTNRDLQIHATKIYFEGTATISLKKEVSSGNLFYSISIDENKDVSVVGYCYK